MSKLRGINLTLPRCPVAIVPVLTEQAIKGASLIEDSQVFVAVFGSLRIGKLGIPGSSSTGTDPIRYAVGGQGIIIPTDIAFAGGRTDKPVPSVNAESAIAHTIWRDTASINAKLAFKTCLTLGRLLG